MRFNYSVCFGTSEFFDGSYLKRARLVEDCSLRGLDVEFEEHDVAVLDDVFFAFHSVESALSCDSDGAALDEVLVGDGFGFDEASFEVGVDDSGGLGRGVSLSDCPGADFFFAGGEEGLQAEELIGVADEGVGAGFLNAEFGEEV